jgi:hypothetical protein
MSVLTYTRGGLEDVPGEHPERLLVAAVAGEFAALAVEDHGVDAVQASIRFRPSLISRCRSRSRR